MLKPNLPVWRSLLYVPINVERYVRKAHLRGADCIQLDLEDSIPASEKDSVRGLVPQAARQVRQGGADVVVRINSPMETTVKDLDACICQDVDGIAVTKVQSAEHIRQVDDQISQLESKRGLKDGHTRLIAMIESPAAFFQMPSIAEASPRLAAMNIPAPASSGSWGRAASIPRRFSSSTNSTPRRLKKWPMRPASLKRMPYTQRPAGHRGHSTAG